MVLTTLAAATQASHNFNNDPSSHYTFTQNVSLDLDDVVPPPMTPPPPASARMVCSTLICDAEFLISAMMINGGDMHQPPNSNFEESDDDHDDDHDDDDDDDGHSSMLSNISLRRSLATSNGASSSYVQDSTSNFQKDNVPTSGLTAFVSSTQQRLRSKLL